MSTPHVISGKRSIGEVHHETRTLIEVLRRAQVGEIVDYSRLSAACGRDVQKRGRSVLSSALRIALRDHGMVFDAVRNIGMQRLDSPATVRTGQRTPRRIHRAAKRELVRQGTVKRIELSDAEKAEHSAVQAVTAALLMHSARSMLRAAENIAISIGANAGPGDIEKLLRPRKLGSNE